MLTEAHDLLDERRYAEALQALGGILDETASDDPLWLSAQYLAGIASAELGRFDEATDHLQKAAAEQNPRRHLPLLRLARLLWSLGRMEEAERQCRCAVTSQPNWPTSRAVLAQILVRRRKPAEAEAEARLALELDDGQPAALSALGCALFQRRRYAEAASVFQRLADQTPSAAEPYYLKARAQIALGQADEAFLTLRRAVTATPPLYRAQLRLASMARRRGQALIAEGALHQAAATRPEATRPRLELARLLLQRDRHSEAEIVARELISRHPDSFEAHVVHALATERLELHQKAESAWHRALRLRPGHLEALGGLARTQRLLGKDVEAEATLRDALKMHPGEAYLSQLLGSLLLQKQRPAEAQEVLKAALERDPERPMLWVQLAQANLAMDQLATAREAVERSLELRPNLAAATALQNRILQRLPGTRPPNGDRVRGGPGGSAFMPSVKMLHQKSLAPHTLRGHARLLRKSAVVVRALLLHWVRVENRNGSIGYLSLILQPMIMLLLLVALFSLIRSDQPGGMHLALFLVTGVGAWQFFQDAMQRLGNIVKPYKFLLNYPRVTLFDLRVAMGAFAGATNLIVLIIFCGALLLFGIEVPLDNLLQVICALFLMLCMGWSGGVLLESLAAVWSPIRMFNAGLQRVLFMSSGIFFSVGDLPAHLHKWILLNPLLHLIELVRNGFAGNFPLHGANFLYPTAYVLCLSALAIVLERRTRPVLLEAA